MKYCVLRQKVRLLRTHCPTYVVCVGICNTVGQSVASVYIQPQRYTYLREYIRTVLVIIKFPPNARTHGYRYGHPTNAQTGV